MPYQVNVVSVARSNEEFRRVLLTGERSQLVVNAGMGAAQVAAFGVGRSVSGEYAQALRRRRI